MFRELVLNLMLFFPFGIDSLGNDQFQTIEKIVFTLDHGLFQIEAEVK